LPARRRLIIPSQRDLVTIYSMAPDGRWAQATTERLLGSATSSDGFVAVDAGTTYWLPSGMSIDMLLPLAR